MSLTWNLAVNCWIVLTFSCLLSFHPLSTCCLFKQSSAFAGDGTVWHCSNFASLPVLPFQLWIPEPQVLPYQFILGAHQEKTNTFTQRDAQLWLEEIFPKFMSYGQGWLSVTCSSIMSRVEKVLHQLMWADLSNGHAENANNNYKHWKCHWMSQCSTFLLQDRVSGTAEFMGVTATSSSIFTPLGLLIFLKNVVSGWEMDFLVPFIWNRS